MRDGMTLPSLSHVAGAGYGRDRQSAMNVTVTIDFGEEYHLGRYLAGRPLRYVCDRERGH